MATLICQSKGDERSVIEVGLYLCFHDDPGDCSLHDIGSIQTIDTVDTEHPVLLADNTPVVHPADHNTTQPPNCKLSVTVMLAFASHARTLGGSRFPPALFFIIF